MPRVNGKEYPYTKSGMAAAEKAKKKKPALPKSMPGGPAGKPKPQASRPAKPQMPQRPESRRRNIPLDTPPKPRPLPHPVSKTRISGATTSRAGSIIGGITPMPKPGMKRRVGGSGMPVFPSAPKKRIGGGKPLFPKKQGR